MLKRTASSLLILCMLLLSAPLFASNGQLKIYQQISPNELLRIMQSQGYTAEVDMDGDILWRLDGLRTYLLLEDTAMQFYAVLPGVRTSIETVNEWNRTKRYSRSYLDHDRDPVLELDLDLEGGVTEARIVDFLKTSRLSLSAWLREVMQ